MSENKIDTKMAIWDSLKTTNPKYTKAVTFGRKFTSINSQWQLQRMTEQFGPVGLGWGYKVAHSVERIADDYVLAIADVTIWTGSEEVHFGPVRGMSPIVEKGKNGLHFDDDAGKKAMTDALTKGLSHLGLSADVFLGLFDDNKYVRSVEQQMAKQEPLSSPRDFVSEALADGLVRNGDTRSTHEQTYVPAAERKAIADLNKTALFAISTSANRIELKTWWAENRPVLREKLPEADYAAIIAAVEAKRDDLPAVEPIDAMDPGDRKGAFRND